jgi:heptosyltransferase-2
MNPAPETLVLLRFSAVGDVVLTSPAVEAIHRAWPSTKIIYALKAGLEPLVQHNPYVHEVVGLRRGEGPLSFSRRLRAYRPDAVLDLHNKARSKLLRLMMPNMRHVVWHKRTLRETVSVKMFGSKARATGFFASKYHAAVEALVGASVPEGRLQHFLGPNDRARAEELLRGQGIDLRRPLVGLSPGANWKTKRWPAERFGELSARALSQGHQVAVVGSAAEKPLGAAICQVAPGVVDLTGQLDLPGLGGFLACCSAFVTNDTGPMHMARALGVPTLAFFGSTDPGMFDFRGHAVLYASVPCSPCSFFGKRRCPKGHFRCMLDLDVASAWRALEPLLLGGKRELLSA